MAFLTTPDRIRTTDRMLSTQIVPAAGADFSIGAAEIAAALGVSATNVPAFQIFSLRAQFLTAAVVAARLPRFKLVDQTGTVIFSRIVSLSQSNSLTVNYFIAPGIGYTDTAVLLSECVIGWPSPIVLDPLSTNLKIASVTGALQVGDQWTVQLHYMALAS